MSIKVTAVKVSVQLLLDLRVSLYEGMRGMVGLQSDYNTEVVDHFRFAQMADQIKEIEEILDTHGIQYGKMKVPSFV